MEGTEQLDTPAVTSEQPHLLEASGTLLDRCRRHSLAALEPGEIGVGGVGVPVLVTDLSQPVEHPRAAGPCCSLELTQGKDLLSCNT